MVLSALIVFSNDVNNTRDDRGSRRFFKDLDALFHDL